MPRFLLHAKLGRRNLSDENRMYCIGKMYEARKKTQGTNNQYVQAKNEKAQNGIFQSGDTAQNIANELGIGRNTVRRSERFSQGVDAIREVSPAAAEMILYS